MLFNSPEFIFIFIPIVLLFAFLAQNYINKEANIYIIILSSIFFYGFWNISYVPLLLGSVLFNFLIHKKIKDSRVLITGLIINVSVLLFFKYTNFFIDNLSLILDKKFTNYNIALPLAISFFTFQQIAFIVDSYKNKTTKFSIHEYILFITFFPQLIAGPIVRFHQFIPQLQSRKLNISLENFSIGIVIFSIGLFKKIVLADQLGIVSDNVFLQSNQHTLSFFESWGGILAFTFQIYFDFSGYSDMAIGLGQIFGIRLPLNFNSPYKSKSIIDFWRRWHISLSSFLKEYIYIPLGGNKKGTFIKYLNILVVMILGGIWHGAGWNFILWGFSHGILLIINHEINRKNIKIFLPTLAKQIITFLLVTITWVLFRAENILSIKNFYSGMIGQNGFYLDHRLEKFIPFTSSLIIFEGLHIGSFDLGGVFYIAISMLIISLFANTNEIINKKEKSLINLKFDFNIKGSIYLATILFISIQLMFNIPKTEFLYFDF
ncbi:MAG: MBOAT family O-acyltransferase [Dehalococcoidia bacterium]